MKPPLPLRRYIFFLSSLLILTGLLLRTGIQSVRQFSKPWNQDLIQPTTATSKTDVTKISTVENDEKKYPTSQKRDYPRARVLDRKATVVVALSGEMANNLMHIAHGIGLQKWASQEYNIDMNIVLRHQVGPNNRAPKPKWKMARNAIHECFPSLKEWDFSKGNSKDFSQKQELQHQWLGSGNYDYLTGLINSPNASDIERGLLFLANTVLTDPDRPFIDTKSSIRLPFLYSETLDAFPLIDKYYKEIRSLFQFNETACCNLLPTSNEYVFHYRNYMSEMPSQRAYEMGFAELSPNKTVNELFINLPRGSKVSVTTRIPNRKAFSQVEALQKKGMESKLVEDQTGVQDFCFLMKTERELVGNARSTFVFWAALLGSAHRIRLYHVNNHGLRKKHPNFLERFTYNWTNTELQERVHFELYQAEETD